MRRSGRTLRSLLQAHQLAKQGNTVFFVSLGARESKNCKQKFVENFVCDPTVSNLVHVGSGRVLFSPFANTVHGYRGHVIFDHSVTEFKSAVWFDERGPIQIQMWDEVKRRSQ